MLLTKLSILLGTALICALNVPFELTKVVDYKEQSQSEVFYHRNMQHSEMLNNYTKVNYKYESNEVNSIDDLVPGNIYSFYESYSVDELGTNFTLHFRIISGTFVLDTSSSQYSIDEILNPVNLLNNSYIVELAYFYEDDVDEFSYGMVLIGENIDESYIGIYINDLTSIYTNNLIIQLVDLTPCDEDYLINFNSSILQYTDYNEILSVEYIQPTTIVGVINEFCETYLFSEIPFVQSMTFEIGGQSINLMTYLVILVGLAVGIGLLILLFFVFKWLFYLFGSIFKKV